MRRRTPRWSARAWISELKTKRLARDRQRLLAAELQRQVDALKLRAPVAGRWVSCWPSRRPMWGLNAPLLSVVDLSAYEVELQVPGDLRPRPRHRHAGRDRRRRAALQGRISTVSPEVVGGQVTRACASPTPSPAGLRQSQQLTTRILLDERDERAHGGARSLLSTAGGARRLRGRQRRRGRAPRHPGRRQPQRRGAWSGVKEGERSGHLRHGRLQGAERVVLTR